ncbi:hypothetical protein [Metabacillus malikii]|uniref:Membrane protein n=1 Tax=Metabacillus malikii TaxID=1504265 RepID=A0ABT9ZGP9_9BACI|nr:hypothetical protein [Metabacillus malikii]MDQ0230420.1 putative membrane protein [Metabacillus malikii]
MRWKNYGLWVSITSLIYMVLNDMGYKIDLTKWETYVTVILGILVSLGVLSNPENGRGYFKMNLRRKRQPSSGEDEKGNTVLEDISGTPINQDISENSEQNETENKGIITNYSEETEDDSESFNNRRFTPYEK